MVDDLLCDLNRDATGLPNGVFYADDGALLYSNPAIIPLLLSRVQAWCTRNGITLKVPKCGHVSATYGGPALDWGADEIPHVGRYKYLGFPVTAAGISFGVHLDQQLEKAVTRTSIMSRHSAQWGVANRLRVFKQYLCPGIEYGAPLVWAWAAESPSCWALFRSKWKELIVWIANGAHA